VLENDDFIAWANENCVCAVGHDGAVGGKEDHKPAKEVDPKTKAEREICPSYAGLTCEEHRAIAHECRSVPEGQGRIGESQGVPNHWVVYPDGKVEGIENKDAALPKTLIEVLTADQKKIDGKPIPMKKWDVYRKAFDDGDKAAADGKWKASLAAYAKVDADAKKLSKGILEKLEAKAKDLSDKVAAKFAELKDGEGDDATKLKAVKALRAEVGAKLSSGPLACVADLDTWIKETTAAVASASAAPAK
jgi:hypothetical protein